MAPRLYEELGLTETATDSDIKRAYHRKALECHPDKVGPSGEAQFKRINEAYTILKDPKKREVYDKHGEQGLNYMNNDMAAPMMDQLGLHTFISVASLLSVFSIACLITLVACVASKLDGNLDNWSWATTLFGLWLWWAIAMLVVVVYVASLVHSKVADRENSRVGPRHFAVPFVVSLYFIASVLIGINLDHNSMRWFNVAVPFCLAEAFLFVANAPSMGAQSMRTELEAMGLTEVSNPTVYYLCFHKFYTSVFRFATAALLGFRASGSMSSSWVAALIPVIIYLFLVNVHSNIFISIQVNHGRARPQDRIGSFVITLLVTVMLFVSVVLVGLRADGAIDIGVGKCLIPFLILLSGALVSSCIGFCVATTLAARNAAASADYAQNHDPGAPEEA